MKIENKLEDLYWRNDINYILGIDEAGRGPIAGPLVVAGVCFPKSYDHDEIYDSKKISKKKREELFQVILHDAIYYKILIVDVDTIDTKNIYRATQNAMHQIICSFDQVDYVLTDAMPIPDASYKIEPIIKGDQKSISIAAASILAKVVRDHIMDAYHILYPMYGFQNHKGYPTKFHLQMLEKYGVLEIHRKSYKPVAQKLLRQMSLFE